MKRTIITSTMKLTTITSAMKRTMLGITRYTLSNAIERKKTLSKAMRSETIAKLKL